MAEEKAEAKVEEEKEEHEEDRALTSHPDMEERIVEKGAVFCCALDFYSLLFPFVGHLLIWLLAS